VIFVLTLTEVESLTSSSILDELECLTAVAKEGCKVTLDIEQPEKMISSATVLEYVGHRLTAMQDGGFRVDVKRMGESVVWERLVG
jgi:hypothetical protein